jgi:hypothetical protein
MSGSNDPLVEEDRRSGAIPEELQHLPERERAQGLALQRMFAEQEHGLRQNYADWIIRVLGRSCSLRMPSSSSLPGPARIGSCRLG